MRSRHDYTVTAPENQRLLGRDSMPVDEFGRLRILAEPSVCVETGCKRVPEDMEDCDGSSEPVTVIFEDSGSEGLNGGANGSGHQIHFCDTTANTRI